MSIKDEINRISNSISLAYDVAFAFGAPMPIVKNSENLAVTIASIPVKIGLLSVDDSDNNNILDSENQIIIGQVKL